MSAHNHEVSFKKMRSVFLFSLIALLTIAILILLKPFFYPLFWAAVIAVMFHPLYQKILKSTKLTNLSVTATLLAVLVVLILPLAVIATLLVKESFELYQVVQQSGIFSDVNHVSSILEGTFIEPFLEVIKTEWTTYAAAATQAISAYLFESIKNITSNTLTFVFQLFIMFYALYYFFRDGKKMLSRAMHLSPLGNNYENRLFKRFTSTIRATLKSTVIVGGIQGFLGGMMFWLTGIQGAFVWGVIMFALSLIPVLGSVVIWLPAGLIMLALGNVWQGVTIILVGTFIISTIDNFLRPPLVGRDIQMHPLLVLLATLGGLVFFGISGFVIGPIIAALYIAIMDVYGEYYKENLSKNK